MASPASFASRTELRLRQRVLSPSLFAVGLDRLQQHPHRQGGEPAVREEAEVVRHRWRPAAKEGPPPVRQVGQGHAHPAPAPHPQIAPQGAPALHEFTRTLDKNLVHATSSVNDDADHMFNYSSIHCIDTKMFCINLSLLREKRDLEKKSFH
ncbi:uncharacterized protein [Aegilops tauschii subsp. strangulata]|uniref:uncharacterized protein isoform X1 n=1 Tax=Aegilops tauschii subsp. strangulata TaxID=200361 RepID=UPI00098B6E37|nr:uncharacterized protein LOC109777458 isoform X2 [Aegilops tauschii subsp. strangulata]